jgi:hypothetical protein
MRDDLHTNCTRKSRNDSNGSPNPDRRTRAPARISINDFACESLRLLYAKPASSMTLRFGDRDYAFC